MHKRRGTKRHTKKSAARKRNPTKRAARSSARAAHIVVVENPRKPMAKPKKRRRRRHHRKSNPAHASPVRRRRHRRHRRHNPAHHVRHKRRHHRRRHNPGGSLSSVLLAIGAGVAAGVFGNIAAKEAGTLLPTGTPAWAVDAIKVAGGIGAGMGLAKKHPAVAAGIAVGLAAPSALALIKTAGILPDSLSGVGFDSNVNDVYAPPMIEALGQSNRFGNRIEDMSAVELAAVELEAVDY